MSFNGFPSKDAHDRVQRERRLGIEPARKPLVPLGKLPARPRYSAQEAEVGAQVRFDRWLLREWRTRDPAAFQAAAGPWARATIRRPEEWAPDEVDDTTQLVQDAEAALAKRADEDALRGDVRLRAELRGRRAGLEASQKAITWTDAELRHELDALASELQDTPSEAPVVRRTVELLLDATRREAERRRLVAPMKPAQQPGGGEA